MIELITYSDYIDLLEEEAAKQELAELRLAREEFHALTGTFEDGEEWFELRITIFRDWFLLERKGPDNLSPVERLLTLGHGDLTDAQYHQMELLCCTHRSVFQLQGPVIDKKLMLKDLAGGGMWNVKCDLPATGLKKDDIIDTRIVFFAGMPTFGRSTVLHPREANETILQIVKRAREEGMPGRELVDHLDKMKLKLDRYSNVRIAHVYRYPKDAIF